MPLAFSDISTLLSRLEAIEKHDPPLLKAHKSERALTVTVNWFKSHRRAIDELVVPDAVALLSTLLPERRTDRVYGIQTQSLCSILSRGLGLSASRTKDLQAYKLPCRGDLADCTERVLEAGGPPARPPVTLLEVDHMLLALAGQCHFSDPAITTRPPLGSSKARDELVGDVVKRLSPEEGKWLVRLILKDFAPVVVDEALVLRSFHFLLADLLRFQNNLEAAVRALKQPGLEVYPAQPDRRSESLHRQSAAKMLRPVVGVKVGRPDFHKAWSMQHCLKMIDDQKWILERKYDGEYCEVHVDRSRSLDSAECIKIFSKSGKVSTDDKRKLLPTLVDCLRLSHADCKIQHQAIILGELVVYSEREKSILPFDKIRKHVPRSGVFLGSNENSPAHSHEHLAIIFFDLLLLDDEIIMTKPVEERRMWLREVYTKRRGHAMSAEWKTVDFSDTQRAKRLLLEQFAASITERCEGLILKPCGVPYFSLDPNPTGRMRGYIKLKKEYMASLGDEEDFAVVGASYNPQQALQCGVAGIKWTDFHLGCLLNTSEVKRFDAKPVFKVVGAIQQHACIPKPILQALNTHGVYTAKPHDGANTNTTPFELQIPTKAKIEAIFDPPFVLEVLGSGYSKPPNCAFYMLRHARAKKFHQDRSWKDCIAFDELQRKAEAARTRPVEGNSQEMEEWLGRLEGKLLRRFEREGTTTPRGRRGGTLSSVRSGASTVGSAAISTGKQTIAIGAAVALRDGMERSGNPGMQRVSANACPLVQTGRIATKRPHALLADTPCPPSKKHCLYEGKEASTLASNSQSHSSLSVLSDITNQAPAKPSLQTEENKNEQTAKATEIKAPTQLRRTCGINQHPTPSTAKPDSILPFTKPLTSCSTTPRCPLANSTLYLSPRLALNPQITDSLLTLHSTALIPSLHHWNRASHAHPRGTATVSESQAYTSLRKIVLVDSHNTEELQKTLRQILGLNEGQFAERVEVYDYRVLEVCAGHAYGFDTEEVKVWRVGATIFDAGRGRSLFVSRTPERCMLG